MANKKIYIFIVTALIFVATSITAYSINTIWNSFKKDKGVLTNKGNNIIIEPGVKEKQEFAKSFDPVTAQPTTKLKNKGYNKELKTATIEFKEDGNSVELTFDYIEDNGKYSIFKNPDKVGQYIITPIPNSKLNLLEFYGSVYTLDMKAKQIKKFLKDEVNNYNIKDALKYGPGKIYWGSNINVSPQGTKVIFMTNRKGIGTNSENLDVYYETWVKDIVTGEEKPVNSYSYIEVLTWESENSVILNRNFSAIRLNVENGKEEVLVEDTELLAASFPHLVYYKPGQVPVVLNLKDHTEKAVDGIKYDLLCNFVSTQGVNKVIIAASPKRTESTRDLVVLDLETLEYKVLRDDGDRTLLRYSIVDSDTILVTVGRKSTGEEETYTIKIRELR